MSGDGTIRRTYMCFIQVMAEEGRKDRQTEESGGRICGNFTRSILRRVENFRVWWWRIQVGAASSKFLAMGM